VLNAVDVLALEAPANTLYGELRARLERAGQTIGANDLLIAAHALTLGYTVVTKNEREFSRVKDLRIENWLCRSSLRLSRGSLDTALMSCRSRVRFGGQLSPIARP
jgi:PIN domain